MRMSRIWTMAVLSASLVAAVADAQSEEQTSPKKPSASSQPRRRPTQPTQGAVERNKPESTPEPTDTEAGPLQRLPIVREKLDNGLQVVMSPDHSVPTVAVAVYYDVGSRDEQPGRTGFAHLFEHMMFQGSANVGKGEHFTLIMNRGGSVNGTTSHDRTNYFETLPAHELALGLWLEADRMKSLAITQENFENQRQTVMEERRQSYDNQAYMLSMLRINELAYDGYFPYAHSTIGKMSDLQNAPLEAVQEFFDKFYAPNNAVLSIAGDFEPAQAMKLVREYFADIERREVPEYQPPELPEQTAERKDTMVDPNAELPAFHVAYHIPPMRSEDHYALELLAILLGDGESSRMYQKLVKQQELLQQIEVSTDDRRGPDLFSIWAIVAEGQEAEAARKLLFQELDRIAKKGVPERELQKAKNRVRASFVYQLQSNLSRAMNLAEFELYWGNAELLREELAHYQDVTVEDMERVASKYFEAENRTVLDVLPEKPAKADAEGSGEDRKQAGKRRTR